MRNLEKKILIIFLIFLTQCGYSSVYKNNSNNDVKIIISSLEGDKNFNIMINEELKAYYNHDSKDYYEVDIITTLDKVTISKDATGKSSNFNIIATGIFKVKYKNTSKIFSFDENLKIKNNADSFEQKKYENFVKKDFARSMKEKLILELETF